MLRYRMAPAWKPPVSGWCGKWRTYPRWHGWTAGALHVLRILQEVFINILKHSHATVIRVQTCTDDHAVTVRVHDNGAPFDPETVLSTHAGRGLVNLRRRAQAIGGAIAWHADTQGTWFVLRLSLARADIDAAPEQP